MHTSPANQNEVKPVLTRVSLLMAAAAFLIAVSNPASADCAGHQQTVKLPTVTADGTAKPAPQTTVPATGG